MSQEAVDRLYPVNGKVLAPMVRAGTLPLRLQSYLYGADAVYTEEIIDFKMIKTTRVENGVFVDFIEEGKNKNRAVFKTCGLERDRVVFQVGTSDAVRALKTAELVQHDVSGFDINMGCPKHFSISGGMGAALLKKPEVAEDILKTLRRNISTISISCKIRLLDDDKSTVELVRRLESAGAMAIGVHCRETHHRPSEPALWERLRVATDAVGVPVIANGDLYSVQDHTKFLGMSGARCGMFARGALKNASVFRPEGPLKLYDVLKQYVHICEVVDNPFPNTKYMLMQMLHYNNDKEARGTSEVIKKNKVEFQEIRQVFGVKPFSNKDTALSWDMIHDEDDDLMPSSKKLRVN